MVAMRQFHGRWQQALGWLIGILIILLTASGCQQQAATAAPPLLSQDQPVIAPIAGPDDQLTERNQPQPAEEPVEVPLALAKATAAPRQPQAVVWSVDEPTEFAASHAEPATEPVAAATPDVPQFTKPATDSNPWASIPGIAITSASKTTAQGTPELAPETAPKPTASMEPSLESTSAEPTTVPMFYIFGEVAKPGPYKHTGRNRILDMLAQVQPTRRANPAQVLLVRPSPAPEQRQVITIDADRMIRKGDLSHNYRLEAGDILYVPPTGLARFDLALEQLLTNHTRTTADSPSRSH